MSKQSDLVGVSQGSAGDPLYVDSTNNKVGIGTSSPSEPLMVNGNIFASTGDGGGYKLEGNSGIFRQGITGMGFNTNGSEAMRIDSSGNVGIGTDSPSSKMHLQNTSGGSEGYLKVTDAAWGGDVRFGMADGVDNDAIAGVWSNNNFRFYTYSTERMRIDSSGRVTMPYQPSMAAHSQGVSAVVYNGTPYIPVVVTHNVGNHYNASTGTFTCPVAGKYLCNFHFLVHTPNTTSHAAFYWEKNGSRNGCVAHTEYHSNRSYEPISLSWIIDASQNDAITLRADTNDGAAVYQGQYSNMSIRLLG